MLKREEKDKENFTQLRTKDRHNGLKVYLCHQIDVSHGTLRGMDAPPE